MHAYDDVVIVGGGPAGLSTAAALKRVGVRARVLDRNAQVGSSWLERYERLHLHTIRRFSGLAHFGIPRTYPKYLSRAMYAEYLQLYQRRLGIDVEHGCAVDRIALSCDGESDARFRLACGGAERFARSVVIATGQFATPQPPNVPGIDNYAGEIVHSASYSNGDAYAGKRVLVAGIGNTGAEIAADLVERGAARVEVAVRATPPVVPRDFLGTPVQLFGIVLSSVKPSIADRIGAMLSRVALGDLRRYGLEAPQWLPFSAKRIPVIDAGFVKNLKRRTIRVRPAIARFSNDRVGFTDGSEEAFDAVILATGYGTGLRQLLDVPGLLDGRDFPAHASGSPTPCQGLYFMGFFESHRGHLFEIERASRRLARTIASEHAAVA